MTFGLLSGLSQEELDDIIQRLNNHIDGMSTKEKEEAVIELIHNTRSRMIPGTRNLPFFLYAEDEEPPKASQVDEEGRPIDESMSDEKIVVKGGKGENAPREKGYRSLPSSSARLEDPRTDSERSSRTSASSKASSTSSKVSATGVMLILTNVVSILTGTS